MQNIILIMIFALLLVGTFLFTGINPFRRKSYISLSKQMQEEKFRNVDERFSSGIKRPNYYNGTEYGSNGQAVI